MLRSSFHASMKKVVHMTKRGVLRTCPLLSPRVCLPAWLYPPICLRPSLVWLHRSPLRHPGPARRSAWIMVAVHKETVRGLQKCRESRMPLRAAGSREAFACAGGRRGGGNGRGLLSCRRHCHSNLPLPIHARLVPSAADPILLSYTRLRKH